LGGGIPPRPDWQADAIAVLDRPDVTILNPRRPDYPYGDPDAAAEQVEWEHCHLHLPGVLTLFWFPACDPWVTVQPITLYELGMALGEGRPVVVGVDPGYPRRADVLKQCALADQAMRVLESVADVVAACHDRLLLTAAG